LPRDNVAEFEKVPNEMNRSLSDEISFIDLRAQRRALGARIDDAIDHVLDHGQFIMGPEVPLLEGELGAACGAKEVISCANGTDALALFLMAKNVGPGDAVLCPSFTFAATAEVVAWVGATPVFVDVLPDTFNMCPRSLQEGIATAKRLGLSPVGVIPVDLFGQPADYDLIEPLCRTDKLWILADAAQSFGATYKGRKVGTIGLATTTSFFPAKPLGCYGDGGAVFTDDSELAGVIRSLRVHGQGTDKYDNVRIGLNARLDTIQAAILLEKLRIFPGEIARRNEIASHYNDLLADIVIVPKLPDGCVSTWAQYTIRVTEGTRDAFRSELTERKIPTAIYYPIPLHQQTAYRRFPIAGNGLPVSEQLSKEVISLPMHPYLASEVQDFIIDAVRESLRFSASSQSASV
jgi:dTDP-4-amino-4,6-dideoxygalactose transaminase